jgi:hypothetical protein
LRVSRMRRFPWGVVLVIFLSEGCCDNGTYFG